MSYTILPYQNVKIETFLELDYSDSLNNETLQPFSNSREIKHTPVVRLTKRKYVTTKINPIVISADVYSSCQRGSNENGLFREFFPKQTNFEEVSPNQQFHIQMQIKDDPFCLFLYHNRFIDHGNHFFITGFNGNNNINKKVKPEIKLLRIVSRLEAFL